MIAEKDLWYFEDHRLKIDVQNDEVIYEAEEN